MSISQEQYEQLIRKPAIARRNPVGSKAQDAKPESYAFHELLGPDKREAKDRTRYAVCFELRVCRLLDRINAYGACKWAEDLLRYCGLIWEDTEEAVETHVFQTKVKTEAEEMTIILIRPL